MGEKSEFCFTSVEGDQRRKDQVSSQSLGRLAALLQVIRSQKELFLVFLCVPDPGGQQ